MTTRGVWANIGAMPQRITLPAFSACLDKRRNVVERFLRKIKHYRAVAARHELHLENDLAIIKLAAASIWMRLVSR